MSGTLLIANRGEIACRIIRTARAMGMRTVAVFSDADADALHVRLADAAVHIGAAAASESYLLGGTIIAAAHAAGADMVHPGYGFLSENADFAQAVIDAGLIWVGPKPESIRAMGLKDAAKARMIAAGVAVTPGYMGDDQSAARLQAEAEAIGYPVLIKAVAGGGGKGMRKVDAAADFLAALESCLREAKASFGNGDVLLEKWITAPRHIEVQVFGDSHGNVVHLFERDCSLQRRHQKVIEEAPAPGMDAATREAICAAAVRAAGAVAYEGAGTIEFIADASEGLRADRIFFMEMNTRLQVEHPVTESITGVDLVEWQLRVARGEALPLTQADLRIDGHAIEARLYAEDTQKGFLPSTGVLEVLRLGERVRVDSGVREGSAITPFYDPMIAKIIAHGESRAAAMARLSDALQEAAVWPVKTNKGFLVRLLADPLVQAGDMTTGLIAARGEDLLARPAPAAAALTGAARALTLGLAGGDPLVAGLFNFRLNRGRDSEIHIGLNGVATGFVPTPEAGARGCVVDAGILIGVLGDDQLVSVARDDSSGAAAAGDGSIVAPMPGRVIAVDVAEGDVVTAGQRLLVVEAMKMEHALVAPFAGSVSRLVVSVGAQVQVDAVLAVVVLQSQDKD